MPPHSCKRLCRLKDDLYEEVRPTLTSLRADGLWLGIAGNQTVRAGRVPRSLLSDDVDLIGTSDDWGASKPEPEFFMRVAAAVPFESDEILYVGDRCDNDILPAAEAGMHTALVHRGPWVTNKEEHLRGPGAAVVSCP